ncbi:flagellar basal body P-ring formation chaperone FlgA [Rhodohalobacter mucosus]|nr:flagellar basal body P-ring formation chaperone FlgA [Rhodohalobacter mucosus]
MIIVLILLFSTMLAAEQVGSPETTETALIRLAENELADTWPDARFRVDLRWVHDQLKNISIESLQAVRFRSRGLPRGLISADVTTVNGARYPAQFEISVTLQVARLNSPVQRGDLIHREDLTYDWMEFTNSGRLPADTGGAGEWLASRQLRQGSPLLEGDLKQPPSIKRGDQAVMIYQNGKMAIELFCRARQDGAEGEVITLKCEETGKRYRAEVLDNNYVKWRQTL